jgi:precorrin-6B methylase 2
MVGTHWISEEAIDFFRSLVEKRANFLEIGTFDGVVISKLCKEFPQSTFYSIDSFEKAHATDGGHIECVLENTQGCDNFVFLKGRSQNIVPLFESNIMDAIFIDGDHSYEAVLEDIRNCYRIAKDGGCIILHDYNLETVQHAVADSMFKDQNPLVVKDLWCFIKNTADTRNNQ